MRFPESLMRRAEAMARGEDVGAIPPAMPASTVVIMRGTDPFEVLLMRRLRAMAFAGGMHVFPGGRVEEDDADYPGAGGSDLLGAALRETAEECGLVLEGAALRRIAHWVTPEIEPKRFDTHFFACAIDGGVEFEADGVTEADEAFWITPLEAMERHQRGELPMLPPTFAVLEELAGCGTVEEALEKPREIVPLLPRPVLLGDGSLSWVIVHAVSGDVIQDA